MSSKIKEIISLLGLLLIVHSSALAQDNLENPQYLLNKMNDGGAMHKNYVYTFTQINLKDQKVKYEEKGKVFVCSEKRGKRETNNYDIINSVSSYYLIDKKTKIVQEKIGFYAMLDYRAYYINLIKKYNYKPVSAGSKKMNGIIYDVLTIKTNDSKANISTMELYLQKQSGLISAITLYNTTNTEKVNISFNSTNKTMSGNSVCFYSSSNYPGYTINLLKYTNQK